MTRKGKLVSFDENGEAMIDGAYAIYQQSYTKKQLANLSIAVLSCMYVPKTDKNGLIEEGELAMDGMTLGEAIFYRQAVMASHGDMEAAKQILDRAMGKPKQEIDISGKIEISATDYLEELARMDAARQASHVVALEDQSYVIDVSTVTVLETLGV